ncbi:hypothetical protein BC567DRAFT_225333 [Phyllosticta citribraziliensis]
MPDLELEHKRCHQPHPPRANPMCFFNNPKVQNPELQFTQQALPNSAQFCEKARLERRGSVPGFDKAR